MWTLPSGFQRAYWSINLVDFSGLQWQSASVNWMGAEGLQWPYLMKRSCMSGDDINKAKGHPSSSLRNCSTVSGGISSHPRSPLVANMPDSEEQPNVSICSSHTCSGEAVEGPRHLGRLFLHLCFSFFTLKGSYLLLLSWVLIELIEITPSLFQITQSQSYKWDTEVTFEFMQLCIIISLMEMWCANGLQEWYISSIYMYSTFSVGGVFFFFLNVCFL